jgi:hypothetical protein
MLYSKRKPTTEKKEREKKQDPTPPKPLSGKKRNREEETTSSSSSSDPKVEERKKKRRIKNFALVGNFDVSGITDFLEKTNKLQQAIMTFPISASDEDFPDGLRESLMESRQELATQVEFLNHQFITTTTKSMSKLMNATPQDIADTVAAEASDSD